MNDVFRNLNSNFMKPSFKSPKSTSTFRKHDDNIHIYHRSIIVSFNNMPPIYCKGDLVYKYFPQHGWFWGEVTKIDCQNNRKYYYEIKYSDGDDEVITERMLAEIYKKARDKIKANELMAKLSSFVEQFRDDPSVKEIALGPLCQRLIEIVQEIHETNHIVINIKPEKLLVNGDFLMSPPSVKSDTIISTDHLAKSIQFSDFGLITSFVGTKNDPTSQVQGTPLYASLNVHALQTPSRRDDVYAMLYVIGEIVLRIDDLVKSKSDNQTDTATQSYLPWSQAANDADIEKAKLEQMNSIKSPYFALMPTKQIAEQLFKAHLLMHATRFAAEPNYRKIKNLLRDVRIPVSTAPLSGHSNCTREIEKLVVGAFVESYETLNHPKMAAFTNLPATIENVEAEVGPLKGMTITHACTHDIENLPSGITIPVSESCVDRYEPIDRTSLNHQAAVENVEPEPLVENAILHARTSDIENLPSDLEIEIMRLQLERLTLNEQDIASNEVSV